MNEFRLANPLWLTMLIPVAITMYWSARHENRASVLYSSATLIRDLPMTLAQRMKWLLPWVRFIALLLLTISLARPQWGLTEFRVRTDGIAIVMCLDRSGSMAAMDFELDGRRANRLEVVKDVFRRFVIGDDELPGRKDDLIGLISFGGFAEGKAPLTLDHRTLVDVLETVEIAQPQFDESGNIVNRQFLEEEQATAIGDAVALGLDRLRQSEAKSKVIILLSDGENTAGVVDPEDAARAAREFGIKIYSIGVGSTGRAPFPTHDSMGRIVFMPRLVRLDETTLKMMADESGGQYFPARDTAALENVYAEIDQLEKTTSEGRLFTQYRELYEWFLLPALGLILCERLLRWTRFREIP